VYDLCLSHQCLFRYDLDVARSQNDSDMRYLINMDYAATLNINSLGRRIRTHLYFTSESHLHTVLNVLRFADDSMNVLSEHGLSIINGTRELCYLTQIVMRVFEDSRREMTDPRRFRVELLFSPGATATPMQMNEIDRETDASRFDTAPLQKIGRDDLTCQDLEDFFDCVISEGRSTEDADSYEVASHVPEGTKKSKKIPPPKMVVTSPDRSIVNLFSAEDMTSSSPMKTSEKPATLEGVSDEVVESLSIPLIPLIESIESKEEEEKRIDQSKKLRHTYFWSGIALGCFSLGVGCLVMALQLNEENSRSRRRAFR
jgi:hypothetical protein